MGISANEVTGMKRRMFGSAVRLLTVLAMLPGPFLCSVATAQVPLASKWRADSQGSAPMAKLTLRDGAQVAIRDVRVRAEGSLTGLHYVSTGKPVRGSLDVDLDEVRYRYVFEKANADGRDIEHAIPLIELSQILITFGSRACDSTSSAGTVSGRLRAVDHVCREGRFENHSGGRPARPGREQTHN